MATLTLSYDDTLSRVLCAATSLGSAADTALFETSTDQIRWTTVRGGDAVTITAGVASIYHYEFNPGTTNYYRVSAVDTSTPTFVASSTAVTGNNTSLVPTIPAGCTEGDLLIIWAAIRTGTVVCPTGWTVLLQAGNVALLGQRAPVSPSAPTVTFTGGGAGDDTIAQMACIRNLELVPAATAIQLNPSGQNIDYPALAGYQDSWRAALFLGWKADDWTSVATLPGVTEIGEPVSIAGNDAGLVWDYLLVAAGAPMTAGFFTVTGGAAAVSYGAAVALRAADYVTRTTASIVPTMFAVWLKSPSAPYLNRSVVLTGWAETERTTRVGFFTIVSQRDAIAVTDFHSPRTVTITLFADNDAEVAAIDLVLSIGGVVLLHIPPNVALKSMYAGIGTYTYMKPASLSHKARFEIPLTEVIQPDLSIIGNSVTWATLVTRYVTWADVLTANATWAAVLALTGTPADALVGH